MLIALWLTALGVGALVLRYLPSRCFPDFFRGQWYFFYFGMQTTFLLREVIILTQLDQWSMPLTLSHVSAWFVCLITLVEVISLARVRARAPKAIDQILDMVILPLNYVFFCVHNLRLLGSTKPKESTNSSMINIVNATVDAADVWESWALWSVLTIFASVVTSRSAGSMRSPAAATQGRRRTSFPAEALGPVLRDAGDPLLGHDTKSVSLSAMPEGGVVDAKKRGTTREQRAISGLQKLCLYVVQAWVLLNFLINLTELLIKGIVGVHLPSLCPYFLQECMSCSEWYDDFVAPYTQTVLYVFCTVAIYCVFKYEHIFHVELAMLSPYWKFFGVKSVVSVTSFQWAIIRYGLYRNDIWSAYSCYNFICCLELPILAILHMWKAYPVTEGSIAPGGWLGYLFLAYEEDNTGRASCGTATPIEDAKAPPLPQGLRVRMVRWCRYGISVVFTLFFFGSFLWWSLQRTNVDDSDRTQWADISCKGPFPRTAFTMKQTHATDFLRLCETRNMPCQLGYQPGTQGEPHVVCGANGEYSTRGSCAVIGCGTPPVIPHAILVSNRTFWTLGHTVKYSCMRGYRGGISCLCQRNGKWKLTGSCDIVGCGAYMPEIPHAQPLHVPTGGTHAGQEVQFQCDSGFQGFPSATCSIHSTWTIIGRCDLFETTYGCQCLHSWVHCNIWGHQCEHVFGCNHAGENFQWCTVVPQSCPRAAAIPLLGEPDWDYCVATHEQMPEPQPPRGFLALALTRSGFVTLIACVVFLLLSAYAARVLYRRCYRFVQTVRAPRAASTYCQTGDVEQPEQNGGLLTVAYVPPLWRAASHASAARPSHASVDVVSPDSSPDNVCTPSVVVTDGDNGEDVASFLRAATADMERSYIDIAGDSSLPSAVSCSGGFSMPKTACRARAERAAAHSDDMLSLQDDTTLSSHASACGAHDEGASGQCWPPPLSACRGVGVRVEESYDDSRAPPLAGGSAGVLPVEDNGTSATPVQSSDEGGMSSLEKNCNSGMPSVASSGADIPSRNDGGDSRAVIAACDARSISPESAERRTIDTLLALGVAAASRHNPHDTIALLVTREPSRRFSSADHGVTSAVDAVVSVTEEEADNNERRVEVFGK